METLSDESLASALNLVPGSCVALIGAGGKTTTMLRMAGDLSAAERTVLVTTTTRIWPPPEFALILMGNNRSWQQHLRREASGVAALGHDLSAEGKVQGIPPETVCALVRGRVADVVLVEADGAAGRSLKAHRIGEPVIPVCSTHVLVLGGIDAVGRPIDEHSIHRLPEMEALLGVRSGEPLTCAHVALALAHSASLAPDRARVTVLLNKVDSLHAVHEARQIAAQVQTMSPGLNVLGTCRGRVVYNPNLCRNVG